MVEGLIGSVENSKIFRITYNAIVYSVQSCENSLLVILAARVHPVPSRTRKLSSLAPMVLGGQPPGRVGSCQATFSFNQSINQSILPLLTVGFFV